VTLAGCRAPGIHRAASPEARKFAMLKADPLLSADAQPGAAGELLGNAGSAEARQTAAGVAFRDWTLPRGDESAFVAALGRVRTAGVRVDRVACASSTSWSAGGVKQVGQYVSDVTIGLTADPPVLHVKLTLGGGTDAPTTPFPSPLVVVDPRCSTAVRTAAGL
jgi:hypothetical protein